jgi:N-formylglutamate amidohydrolase
METYELHCGETPLLISVPHAGTHLPDDIRERMGMLARILPDTDWHVDKLYEFAQDIGAGMLVATHSRYVVDLNRSPDDDNAHTEQVNTGFVPLQTFSGFDLYQRGQAPDALEIQDRAEQYWQPYHDALAAELSRLRDKFGYAILYDAHSTFSEIPQLFDGVLPDLNLGTANGSSCAPQIERGVAEIMEKSGFSTAVNGRFTGGYITRHYGQPDRHIHALEMELSARNYMMEIPPYDYNPDRAEILQGVLKEIIRWLNRTS